MASHDAASPKTTPPPPPAAPRRRRWRRRLAWTFAILLLLLLLAPLALGLSPIRTMVAEKVGAALGRKVEIGSLSAYWFKGVDLEDVTIHSPDGFDGPLATIARVHADVDVLGYLGGTFGARVRIVQPHVTVRRDATGASNTKDLGPAEQPSAPGAGRETAEPARVDLELVLVAGTVEALNAGGKAENALRDIQLTASVKPDGETALDLQALAEGAGEAGRDARLKLVVSRDAANAGVFRIDVPALQLSRLGRLVEDTLAVSDLQGTVEAHGEGTLHADDTIAGTLSTHLESVAARTPDGTRLSVRRVMGTAKLRSVSGTTEADIGIGMGDVRVQRQVDGRIESFREPDITLQTVGRYDPEAALIRIAKGTLQGGDLVQVLVKEPVRIEGGDATRFGGRLDARISLGRLGSLRGLFPALEPLAAGTLSAILTGHGAKAQDLGVGVTVTGLALRPSDLAPSGYSEPRIVAAFRVGQTADGQTRIHLSQLGAQVLRLTAKDERGVTLTLGPGGGYAVEGDFTLGVGLQSLSRLLGSKLGLEPGERLGGTLQLVGSGRGTTDEMRLTMDLHGTRISFPPSWGSSPTPAALTAKIVSTRKDGESVVTLSDLAGMGLGGSGTARLRDEVGADGVSHAALQDAEAQLTVDLARARPWLGGMLGMNPAGRLGGRVRADLRVVATEDGRRLVTTTQVNDLYVQARPRLLPIREKRVTLRGDLLLAEAGGRHKANELKLDAAGLKLDMSGSTYVAEPDAEVDVNAVVGGDAAQLAPTLAALLGEGYEDLRGTGRLSGTIKLTGSPADNARALFTTTDVALGSWTTSGLKVDGLLLRAIRADVSAPLGVRLKAGLNGGTALVTTSARLGGKAIPWSSTVELKRVDTSGLLVTQGAGRYLTFVLPALLPSQTKTPVLSGRLDANLKGSAPALRGDAMRDGLVGSGRIAMEQGEIKQSTLFGGGETSNLGRVIRLLQYAQPEVGAVMVELQKAISFSSLVSEFSVAKRVVTVKQTKLTGQRVLIDMQGRVHFAGPIDLKSWVALTGKSGKRMAKVLGREKLPLRIKGTLERPHVEPSVDVRKLIIKNAGGNKDLVEKLKKKLPKLPNPFK